MSVPRRASFPPVRRGQRKVPAAAAVKDKPWNNRGSRRGSCYAAKVILTEAEDGHPVRSGQAGINKKAFA